VKPRVIENDVIKIGSNPKKMWPVIQP